MNTRGLRIVLAILVAAGVFALLVYPSFSLYLLTLRESYRLSELLGIMDPGGDLGGQIMGFNYQRNPRWVHPIAKLVGAAVGYGPALIVALLTFHRVGLGPLDLRATLCGRCGRRLKDLREPRCPACRAPF